MHTLSLLNKELDNFWILFFVCAYFFAPPLGRVPNYSPYEFYSFLAISIVQVFLVIYIYMAFPYHPEGAFVSEAVCIFLFLSVGNYIFFISELYFFLP